jgi:hypothetical protein
MNHQSFDISGMLRRVIASADVTADETRSQDADISRQASQVDVHDVPQLKTFYRETLFIDYAKDLSVMADCDWYKQGIFERSVTGAIGRSHWRYAIVQTECFGGSFCVVCDRSTERTVE